MSFNDGAIVSVKGNDYRIHLGYMNKDETIDTLNDVKWITAKI